MESLPSASLDSLHKDINPAECRIINLDLLDKHIKEVADHFSKFHSEDGPPGEHIILAGEKTHGLASILRWKCTLCDEEISFSTSTKAYGSKGHQYWSCILAAVWGQMVTGGGFNPLQESMSILGIPVMFQAVLYANRVSNRRVVVECITGINESCRKTRKITCN